MQIECYSYDRMLRGSWYAEQLDAPRLTNQADTSALCFWLPTGTPMRWNTGTRPLRNDALQFFWPDRWYALTAFYAQRTLTHAYASIIQPFEQEFGKLKYIDLELTLLIEANLSVEVLTQAEYEFAAANLRFPEELQASIEEARQAVASPIQLRMGYFTQVPVTLPQFVGAM